LNKETLPFASIDVCRNHQKERDHGRTYPPQQSASPSTRVEELDKAFVADLIEQPKQLDKLARLVLIFSFVVPVLYAIGLKF